MIEYELTEEQIEIQKMAREFAEKEIRPIAERLDRSGNPLEDFPWDLVRKGSQLGLRTLALPGEWGGPGLDFRTWVVVIEELGYADVACARIFSENWKICLAIAGRGSREQKDRILSRFGEDDTFLLAAARGEPGAGRRTPGRGPVRGTTLSARRVEDRYVLSGRSGPVPLGPVAKLVLVEAGIVGKGRGAAGTGTLLVPRASPGVGLGAVHDRVGVRAHVEGALQFDDVEVPTENVLRRARGGAGSDLYFAADDIELSAHAMGLSRAALDAAIRYANERIQGGRPIIQHQAVATTLADLYIRLQAGRGLLWRAAWVMDGAPVDRALTMACRGFCTQAAVEICENVVELFGGSGVMRELPIQKYFRDSLVLANADGPSQAAAEEMGALLESRVREGRLSR